jgi:hypothetical protein
MENKQNVMCVYVMKLFMLHETLKIIQGSIVSYVALRIKREDVESPLLHGSEVLWVVNSVQQLGCWLDKREIRI